MYSLRIITLKSSLNQDDQMTYSPQEIAKVAKLAELIDRSDRSGLDHTKDSKAQRNEGKND